MREVTRNLASWAIMAASVGLSVYLCILAASCGGDPKAEQHNGRPIMSTRTIKPTGPTAEDAIRSLGFDPVDLLTPPDR